MFVSGDMIMSKRKKVRHSKIKNTGLLFECLTRQLTVDVLNKAQQSKAMKIIKKRFNEQTELGKELQLYNILMTKKKHICKHTHTHTHQNQCNNQ